MKKFWSAAYDSPTKMGKSANVMHASMRLTRLGVQMVYTMSTQMYANIEKKAVMRKTVT
jgi:hypothetical protein